MDHKIVAIQNATSSAQLKAAVDAVPREEKYFITQVRNLLLQKQQFIVDSPTADSVIAFLCEFGLPKSGEAVLQTPEIRDLIINILAPKISDGQHVYCLGRAICNIVQDKSSAELYSTPETLKVILSFFHRAKNAQSAAWISWTIHNMLSSGQGNSSSIYNMLTFNPTAIKPFSDLPVVEAFSAVLPHATSDEAVSRVSKSLRQVLLLNNEGQKMFGTPAFFELFKSLEKFAISYEAETSFKKVVDILQPIVNRRNPIEKPLGDATTSQELTSALNNIIKQSDCWPTLVDLLLSKQHLIQHEEITISTAKFIKWCCEKNEKSIQTKEIYDLFRNILLPKSLNFTFTIPHVHEALALIVKNKEAQEFFATPSFKEYIVASLPHSNQFVLQLLNSLLVDNKKGQEIFGTPDFKEELENKFVANVSKDFISVTKFLNDRIAQVRFETLRKLAADHNEVIPERLLQKLAQSGANASSLFNCDGAVLLATGVKVEDVIMILTFMKNIKDKNNGVAPIHHDPFKPFELEQLRQEHNDLRKLHQDLITSSSKSIGDLNLELREEKKNHTTSTTKFNQGMTAVVADRDAKEKAIDNLESKINGLETNLADEKKRSSDLEKSLETSKKLLRSAQQKIGFLQSQLDVISPFVTGKLYQIDYGILNLPPPQTGVVAELRSVPSQSRIFAEAEKLMKKGGTLIYDATSPNEFNFSPVKGFTLQSIDVILRGSAGFEERMDRLQGLRLNVTDKFNPAFAAFSPEQQQVLKVLFEHFLPRPPNANPKFPNLVNVFHGTKIDCLDSAIKGLVAMKSTDEGFFGFGVYTTTSIEYAAKYARGDFDPTGQSPARADGCYPVLWCVAAVGVCNPVSRADDYSKNRVDKTFGVVSDFFGSPLAKNCDCHCALVGGSQSYQAVPPQNMEYLEMVVDQENQVIPIAVLWVKP